MNAENFEINLETCGNLSARVKFIYTESILPVLSIAQNSGGEPSSFMGTCFLIRTSDNLFLCTAHHVLKAVKTTGFFTIDSERNFIELNLSGRTFENEELDVALIDETSIVEFEQFALVSNFSSGFVEYCERDVFALYGYPHSVNKKSWPQSSEMQPYFVTFGQPSTTLAKEKNLDPDVHVTLEFDIRDFSTEGGGVVERAISPRGLSGSPIIHCGTIDEIRAKRGNIDPVTVGIFTSQEGDLAWGSRFSAFLHVYISRMAENRGQLNC